MAAVHERIVEESAAIDPFSTSCDHTYADFEESRAQVAINTCWILVMRRGLE
jgi:hypothetical protein